MHKRNETANFDLIQIVLDNILVFFSYVLAHSWYKSIQGQHVYDEHLWIYCVFSVIFTLSMLSVRMYNFTTFYYVDRMIRRTVLSVLIASVSLSMVIFMGKMYEVSRMLFLLFCGVTSILVVTGRCVARMLKREQVGNGYTRILFIGDRDTQNRFTRFIEQTALRLKIDKAVYFDDASLATSEAFSRMLMHLTVDQVILVHRLDGECRLKNAPALLEICESMGITIQIIIDGFDLPLSKSYVSSIGSFPVITYHSVSLDRIQLFIKSLIDVAGSAVGLLLLSPIFILTAIAIKLDSPGPVFFKQKRAGINGKPFTIYKFRSMYIDAEERKHELMTMNKIKDGMMFKIDNDPRITRVGAFIRKASIDELPQLINVLKRDMSLVGTRPPTMDELVKYGPEQWRRLSILPGITGMWQVNGRSQILDFDEVVRLDKQYIDEWSLALDFDLLVKTIKVVFTTHGAY